MKDKTDHQSIKAKVILPAPALIGQIIGEWEISRDCHKWLADLLQRMTSSVAPADPERRTNDSRVFHSSD